VSWSSGEVLAAGVNYRGDPSLSTSCDFSVESVKAEFKLLSLLKDAPVVKRVELSRPRVTVREKYDAPPPPRPESPPPGYALAGFPAVRVGEVQIHEGEFIYEQLIYGKTGRLEIHHVNSKTGSFVTRDWLLSSGYRHPLDVKTTAVLGGSGKVLLDLHFDPFAEKNVDQILIGLENQDMKELDPLFSVTDGVGLTGVLKRAWASLEIREGKLSGNLEASYDHLQFKYQPIPGRGKIVSKLTQILHSLSIAQTRPKKNEKTAPSSQISEQRQPEEPITKFLLRGLKDAAQKILSS
jgi:hypothetical protein